MSLRISGEWERGDARREGMGDASGSAVAPLGEIWKNVHLIMVEEEIIYRRVKKFKSSVSHMLQ